MKDSAQPATPARHVRVATSTPTFRAIFRKGKAAGLAGERRTPPYNALPATEKLRVVWLQGWDVGDRQRAWLAGKAS